MDNVARAEWTAGLALSCSDLGVNVGSQDRGQQHDVVEATGALVEASP